MTPGQHADELERVVRQEEEGDASVEKPDAPRASTPLEEHAAPHALPADAEDDSRVARPRLIDRAGAPPRALDADGGAVPSVCADVPREREGAAVAQHLLPKLAGQRGHRPFFSNTHTTWSPLSHRRITQD